MTRYTLLALRIAMSIVFLYSAWTKLSQPWQLFAMAVDGYGLLPLWAVDLVARGLPWFELAIGVLLIAGVWLRISAVAATLLLLGFFTILVRSYFAGLNIECGCFGPGDPISPKTLLRDGALLAACVALAVMAWRSPKREHQVAG